MTDREAIDVLFNEWKCIDRNDGIHCDRKCESCDLVMDVWIIREAFNMAISALQAQELSKNSPKLDKENGELHPTCTGSCTGSEELKQEAKNSTESSSTHKALDTISRQAAIDALWEIRQKEISDGRRFHDYCSLSTAVDVIKDLPSAQPEPCKDAVSRADVVDMLEMFPFTEYSEYETAREVVKRLPSAQPEIIRCLDCKYWREHKYAKETKKYIPFCGFNAIYTKSDDFCSKAERRTDEPD